MVTPLTVEFGLPAAGRLAGLGGAERTNCRNQSGRREGKQRELREIATGIGGHAL
jgi:hypothetical protein